MEKKNSFVLNISQININKSFFFAIYNIIFNLLHSKNWMLLVTSQMILCKFKSFISLFLQAQRCADEFLLQQNFFRMLKKLIM